MKRWELKEGTVVYNEYHGIRRYGIIERKTIDSDGWAYCNVNWFNDEQYLASMENRKRLTAGKDWSLTRYRVDKLKRIDLHKELSTLEDIRHELNTRGRSED
jgi:hypothetical protein